MHFVLPSFSLFMPDCTNYSFFISSPARCAIASPESTANDLEVGISPPVNNATSPSSAGLVTPTKTTLRKRRRQLYSPDKSALPHVLDHTRPSKLNRIPSAVAHFDTFIKHHLSQLTQYGITENSDPADLPYHIINNDKFIGQYLYWLAEHARSQKDPEQHLMLNSVLAYASEFKDFYLRKFRGSPVPTSFQGEYWSKYLKTMTKIKTDWCRKNGKDLVSVKETSTEEDFLSIGSVCIWEGECH